MQVCTKTEADIGCGEVKKRDKNVLILDSGQNGRCRGLLWGWLSADVIDYFKNYDYKATSFRLAGHDDKKIRNSLQVNKDDHWFDGTEDIGKTAATDRPLCYSSALYRLLPLFKSITVALTQIQTYIRSIELDKNITECAQQSVIDVTKTTDVSS